MVKSDFVIYNNTGLNDLNKHVSEGFDAVNDAIEINNGLIGITSKSITFEL